MSDWDEAGHVLFVHAPSSVDFVLSARTPNTVPIARPTPPTPKATKANARWSPPSEDRSELTGGAAPAGCGTGSPEAALPSAGAVTSCSSFSETVDSPPSRTLTLIVAGLEPGALAATS